MAPKEWKELMRHPCPDDFLHEVDENSRNKVRNWREKRKHLIAERMRMELEAQFEEHDFDQKPSKPFVKFLIKDMSLTSRQAMLTVWGHSPEQLELLQENSLIRGRQLSVKESRFDDLLQLSGTARTVFTVAPPNPPVEPKEKMTVPKLSRGIFQTNLLSKRCTGWEKSLPIDVVGIVLHSEIFHDRHFTYLTDRSGMLLRVESSSFLLEAGAPQLTPVLLLSVQALPFDNSGCMGVVAFGCDSTCSSHAVSSQFQRVSSWSHTQVGRSCLEHTSTILKARLPTIPKIRSHCHIFLAHVAEVVVLESKHLIVKVDRGESHLLCLNLPLHLLPKIRADENGAKLGVPEEQRMSKLSRLGRLYRSRSLHHITVSAMDHSIEGCKECRYEIVDFRVPHTEALSSWYLHSLDAESDRKNF